MASDNIKEARKKAQEDARRAYEENRGQVNEITQEAIARAEKSKPTPTQEENDLARLGIDVPDKQDDGSGETVIERVVVANRPLGPQGYETRAVRAKKE